MKNYICLLFLLFFYAHTAFGQYTTEGRDFWVSFGNNYNESSYNLILQIRVVAAEKTDVRFTFTELLNIPETITLEAGTVYTRDLSYSEKTAVHSNYSGTTRKSLRIQSDKNVSVYAINLYKNTTDATIVLPVTSLGNSYYHMSYPSLYADGYTLVAIDDNTDIYEDGTLLTTLNTGGVYSRYISSQDLTGKQITSNNPIAYFTTNSCVNIPKDIGYCDCLYEQLFPVALWGTTFMVPVTIRGKERIRIMASQDGTTVVLTGGSIMSTPGKGSLNLNKGEFVEVEIKASEAGCYIEADNPVAVASYLTGSAYSGLDYSLGDPAMTWVSSIEQSVNEIIIAPFIATGSSVLKEYYILIITPTFHKNLTEISIGNNDYEPISGGTWTDNVSGYSYYSLKLTEPNSTYRFMNTEGLTILGYGLGSAESYYYLAGSAARKLDASFYANGIHNQDLDGQEFCEGGDFIIKAVIKYKTHPDPGHLRWLINDVEELDVQDQIEWSKNLSAGDYTLSMIVKDQYSDVDTIKSSFSIFNITDVEINDLTICAGDTAVLNVENPESDVLYQWYDYENSTIIHTGPEYTIPDILEVGVHEYYVKATSPLLNCVSNRVKVNVTVKPLIMPDADNVIIKACYENPSVIFMEGLKTNYTYDLYADELMSNKLASVTGVESAAVNLNATPENNSIYISVVINDLLCSEKLVLKFEIQLIELSLSPEELPIYFNEELYSVQLTSNAVQPVYSYTGDLVTGVSISTDGLISGTVPEEAGVAPKTFTVTVTDENGCTAQREYTLKGCAAAPAVTPELVYCQYDQAPALSATPSEGMTLQWYAGDKTSKLDEAPVPNTDTPGEQVFYVAQINNDLNCEGIKAKITITVNPLPTLDFTATAPTICYQNSPTIELNELDASFVYDIYDDDKRTNKLASVTGVSGSTVNISEVLEVDKTYYISATSALGCASKDLKEVSVKLIKLNILPEQLPVYTNEEPYSVQLTSNAVQPVYSYTGDLVTGISISTDGLISGTVPEEAGVAPKTFTVTVTDENGCTAQREYTLKGCAAAPAVTPELVYCQYDQAPALPATPSEGMTLQWYAGDKTSKLDEAPVPNTDTPGEQVFYVAQINNDLNCEGIKAKITITVNPLPTLDFTATAPTICYQNSPTIELNELDASFVYDIYDDDKRTNKLASVTGVSGSTVNISEVLEVDKTYYISATSALGCASKDLKEVSVKLIKLNILPEQLPIYRKGVEYEQQLSSNAEFPVFTLFEGQLPLGLTINNSGTILGTVVWEENALSATFTVQVEDVNNCRATREYTLKKEMFVPKVFTPNNDGINDIFMLGYKVIIFDRMGITIFEGENGWDGSYKNNPASPDIYFYKLIYQNESGENMIKIGYIGLER